MVCPVCVIAIGAGVEIAEYYGVNFAIIGIWIGALLFSLAGWSDNLLGKYATKKAWEIAERYSKAKEKALIGSLYTCFVPFLALYATIVLPYIYLSHKELLTSGFALGTLAGLVGSFLAVSISTKLKQIKGKRLFPFQTVILTLISLLVISLITYAIVG